MTKTKEQLFNIWFHIWDIPGWLRILGIGNEYDQEDLLEFEQIDENALIISKEAEKYHWENIIPEIKSKIEAFKEEFSQSFRREKRLEYLNSQIDFLENRVAEIWKGYQDATERDLPYWLRSTTLELQHYKQIEKKLKSFSVEKYILENPEALKKIDRITPEQIARAVSFPFDQLIQFNQAGFAICPFHKEKTGSFHWIKHTNKVYCFGCQWKGDIIDFLKERDGLSFKEVVHSLCR